MKGVFAGSTIVKNESMDEKYPDIAEQRAELFDEGVLQENENGIEFTEDHLFTASRGTALSNTASLILHGSKNGKEYWTMEDGKPISMLISKE